MKKLVLCLVLLCVVALLAQEEVAKETKERTGWIVSLSLEMRQSDKSSYEVGIPFWAMALGASVIGVSGGLNQYSTPGCFTKDYKSSFQGPRLAIFRAESGGESASLLELGYVVGYRAQSGDFAYRGYLGLGVAYLTATVSDWKDKGTFVLPLIGIDVGFVF